MKIDVIAVGAGGTGGNFLKEFGRFLSMYHGDIDWTLTIVDGDSIEAKNLERQPFVHADLQQNKALTMQEGLVEAFGLPDHKVSAYTNYLVSDNDIPRIMEALSAKRHASSSYYSQEKKLCLLLGFVDNHRARQLLHNFFYKTWNCIYIDSANEFSEGEVVTGIRLQGRDICPPRGYYYPDVITDRSPRADELSCGVVNASAPQHLATNLFAANICFSIVAQLFQLGINSITGGVTYFDSFKPAITFREFKGICPIREEVMQDEDFFFTA